MRLFACDHCGQPVHFDNRQCVRCGHQLGFVPELLRYMRSRLTDRIGVLVVEATRIVRFCANAELDIGNWVVEAGDPEPFLHCLSPQQAEAEYGYAQQGIDRWRRIGQAERHLFYSLLRWNLPHPDRQHDPAGVGWSSISSRTPCRAVPSCRRTGHDEGRIATRAAEADDVAREQARTSGE